MSRLYDTIEPSVIDEDMLKTAVEEQGPVEQAGKIAKEEGIDFADVLCLRLDFKNILKVDNLWCFTSLTKLQLDNNIIERIEGLEMLVNLVWLDLSFNNIEMIEGLETLTKLEDVTLYNNRISRVENMDALTRLHVFSIGNNNLSDLENLRYLRRFEDMKTLNLSGNPVCDHVDYKPYAIAFLQQLEYMDYRMIEETAREHAKDRYYIQLEELKHDEAASKRNAEEAQQQENQLQLHMEAYVEHLNTAHLFDQLYAEDAEGQKLNFMPGVDELLVVYKEKFVQVCQQIFDLGLQEHEKRVEEVAQFWECVREAQAENKKLGMDAITEFLAYKKKTFGELQATSDQKLQEQQMDEYLRRVTALGDKLMSLELQLVDQLEEVIRDYERYQSDMVGMFQEQVQGLMSQLRDFENNHHERMLEIAIVSLEKVVKNELNDDEIPDDLRQLFVDKDTIINAVTSSHDVHLLKIDNREDEMNSRMRNWMKSMMDKIHEEEEVSRNRSRVTEVNNLLDHLREEVENLELQGM